MVASFAVPTETVFGWGCAEEVGPRAARAGFGRALVVADRGIRGAGLTRAVDASLRGAGVVYDVFDAVSPNPRAAEAEACLAALAAARAEVLVAVGGGSVIDTAKVAGILRTNGGRARDWCPAVGGRTPSAAGLPLFALPTTTGTGSEVSSGAVLTFGEGGAGGGPSKNGVGNCQPALALLDPQLVVGLPAGVLTASGLDALSHAVESYVSPRASLFTRAFSVQAIRTIAWALPEAARTACTPGADRRPSMEAMLYAANLAGRSMLGRTGQVHAISRAVGATFDTVHGLTNAVLLPVVLAVHEPALRPLLSEVGSLLGAPAAPAGAAAATRAIDAIIRLRDALGAPARLRDLGVPREALPRVAAEAMGTEQAQNPRPATEADLLAICERAW